MRSQNTPEAELLLLCTFPTTVPPSASAANGNLVGVEGTSLVLTVTVQNMGDPAVIPAAIIWNKVWIS